jgi:hypothetical protein
MDSLIKTILLHPRLERFRARVPYWIVAGILWFAVFGAASGLMFLGVGPQDIPLIVPIYIAGGMTVLYIIATITGHISGYRPFTQRWSGLTLDESQKLATRLLEAAETLGVTIVWDGPVGSFVGTLALENENGALTHKAKESPLRFSLFVRRQGAHHARMDLKIAIRTICFWNTGETQRCRDLGEQLLALADVSAA